MREWPRLQCSESVLDITRETKPWFPRVLPRTQPFGHMAQCTGPAVPLTVRIKLRLQIISVHGAALIITILHSISFSVRMYEKSLSILALVVCPDYSVTLDSSESRLWSLVGVVWIILIRNSFRSKANISVKLVRFLGTFERVSFVGWNVIVVFAPTRTTDMFIGFDRERIKYITIFKTARSSSNQKNESSYSRGVRLLKWNRTSILITLCFEVALLVWMLLQYYSFSI